MRPTLKLLLAGAVAGIAAGGAAAVAVPERTPAARPATAPSAAAPVVPEVRRVAAMRPVPEGFPRLRPREPLRVGARLPDPRGGPDWAVRAFLADRAELASGGRARTVARPRCVQLGRVHEGRFGWLEADGTFRPVGARFGGAPTQCLSRRPDVGGRPYAEVATTVTDPGRPAADPVQTVVWGLAGPAAQDARLTVGGAERPVRLGAAGVVLAVLGPEVRQADVGLAVRAGGRERRVLPAGGLGPPRGFDRPAPGAVAQLAAQAPDPDGGLPHGMTATRGTGGSICTGSGGRVVGDRVGAVDFSLDLLTRETTTDSCSPAPRRSPDARRGPPPYSLTSSYAGGIGVEAGEDPATGRVARRTLPGRLVLAGTAAPEVRLLTIAGPSDTRTVSPTGPARAFLVVYAGLPATGRLTITTTFRDGSTRRDEASAGI